MAKKKLSETKAAYMKQRRRVQRFIRSAEKRGYSFPDNILPDIPKNPTKASVNRLAKLTPEKLYSKATASVKKYDKTGQAYYTTVNGTTRRKQERSEAGRRGYQAHVEAKQEGFATVQQMRAHVQSVEQQMKKQAKKDNAAKKAALTRKKNKYREWLTDEIAEKFGFDSAEDMLDSDVGLQMLQGIEEVNKAKQEQETEKETLEREAQEESQETPSYETPEETVQTPTGMTQEDIDFANSRAEQDEWDLNHVDETTEESLIWESLNERINSFSGVGRDFLDNLLNVEVAHYGESSVVHVLHDLEEEDPDILEKMENLMFYQEFGNENAAHSAFKALADAIKSHANGDRTYAMRIGNVLSAMEVYSSAK